jgi:hypothetical protein
MVSVIIVMIYESFEFLLQFPREVIVLKFDDILHRSGAPYMGAPGATGMTGGTYKPEIMGHNPAPGRN